MEWSIIMLILKKEGKSHQWIILWLVEMKIKLWLKQLNRIGSVTFKLLPTFYSSFKHKQDESQDDKDDGEESNSLKPSTKEEIKLQK